MRARSWSSATWRRGVVARPAREKSSRGVCRSLHTTDDLPSAVKGDLLGFDAVECPVVYPVWWPSKRGGRLIRGHAQQLGALCEQAAASVWLTGSFSATLAREQHSLGIASGQPVMSWIEAFAPPLEVHQWALEHSLADLFGSRPDLLATLTNSESYPLVSWTVLYEWYYLVLSEGVLTQAWTRDEVASKGMLAVQPEQLERYAAGWADVALHTIVAGGAGLTSLPIAQLVCSDFQPSASLLRSSATRSTASSDGTKRAPIRPSMRSEADFATGADCPLSAGGRRAAARAALRGQSVGRANCRVAAPAAML